MNRHPADEYSDKRKPAVTTGATKTGNQPAVQMQWRQNLQQERKPRGADDDVPAPARRLVLLRLEADDFLLAILLLLVVVEPCVVGSG